MIRDAAFTFILRRHHDLLSRVVVIHRAWRVRVKTSIPETERKIERFFQGPLLKAEREKEDEKEREASSCRLEILMQSILTSKNLLKRQPQLLLLLLFSDDRYSSLNRADFFLSSGARSKWMTKFSSCPETKTKNTGPNPNEKQW